MRLSKLFTKTRQEAPSDEVAKNAQLLIKAGFINKEMAGVYSYLPLGLRVMNKITQIIREELDAIGGQELFLTTLQRPEIWQTSGRWDDEVVDIWFKSKLANGQEVGLANTHEEALASLMKQHISSYKDLPVYPYQFQTKFRNELRSKSGIMRGREFVMKDMYSFSKSQQQHQEFYEKAKEVYRKIFDRIGLGETTFLTYADGGSFSEFSHEFQTLTEAGEDTIFLSRTKGVAINKEVFTAEVANDLGLKVDELEEVKATEVGNIFSLGTKFSDALGLKFTDKDGQQKSVVMGSYGIGPGRTMGAVVEQYADEHGLVWPESIAPARVHLVRLGSDEALVSEADDLYRKLTSHGVEVIYDDRSLHLGKMLGDADLMGVPTRVIVSPKSLAGGGVEVKSRTEAESSIISPRELISGQLGPTLDIQSGRRRTDLPVDR